MKIAVVGAGIAGLSAAWLLRETHQVTLFEADQRAGGHADTQNVTVQGDDIAVDMGFIVYNTHNYPHLTGLFEHLGIDTRHSDMSFGISVRNGALEYGGGDLGQLFAQRRNALRPRFWGMVRDILRFYREAPKLLTETGEESLGDWLVRRGYGSGFVQDHILPMGAAIWSASVDSIRSFPAQQFARFFHNHGLLNLTSRPSWRTVEGGSRRYVEKILADLGGRVRLGSAVEKISRDGGSRDGGVHVHLAEGRTETFDAAILACHADQSLALLAPPTAREAELLGAVRCTDNRAVLHTDPSLMPRRRGVWSAWNYLSDGPGQDDAQVSVTYWMNRLQGMVSKVPLLVTLNPRREPKAGSVLAERNYRHPQFDAAALRAQTRLAEIQGIGGVWFAGAWTGWGFHEDGIASAVRIAAAFGVVPPWVAASERLAA
jgi:predicted NAD/FAD-binding protein